MKFQLAILIVGIVSLAACLNTSEREGTNVQKQSIPGKKIELAQLESMFDEMKKNTNYDMKEPMLWGYFFTHHEPKKLEKAKAVLVQKGYRFVNIHISEKKTQNEPDLWWLHVEKEEIHTPTSLDKLNDEFCLFANKMGLDSYDGMDVGPIQRDNQKNAPDQKAVR